MIRNKKLENAIGAIICHSKLKNKADACQYLIDEFNLKMIIAGYGTPEDEYPVIRTQLLTKKVNKVITLEVDKE